MTGCQYKKTKPGFTLVEVIVATGIFTLTALMAVNLFVLFVQHQRRTLTQQELQNDGRAAMELIAQDIREGVPDYEYYENIFSGTQMRLSQSFSGTGDECLVLRDALNAQIIYRVSNNMLERAVPASPDSTQTCQNVTEWDPITPDNLKVESFQFTISPSENPVGDFQPKVCTVDLECRWGTLCLAQSGGGTCQFERDNQCYCYPWRFGDSTPLHPLVMYAVKVSKTNNQQVISQLFQTTIASRIFTNFDKLNSYVP